jgi:hypothetical protein
MLKLSESAACGMGGTELAAAGGVMSDVPH